MDSDSFKACIIEGICLHVFIQLVLPEDALVKPSGSELWLDFRIIKVVFLFVCFLKDNDPQAPPPKFDLIGLGGVFFLFVFLWF